MPSGSSSGGGDEMIPLEPYKYEIFQQCFAATEAWNRAYERLSVVPPAAPVALAVTALKIASDLQGFALAVGILSDLFFPTPGKGDQARGERLRNLYGVQKGTSRLENRHVKVRHSLVHLDQELDRWLKMKAGQEIGSLAIRPWDGPAPSPADATHVRIIDNKNWRMLVLGRCMEFKPLFDEITRIGRVYPLEVRTPFGVQWISLGAQEGPSPR